MKRLLAGVAASLFCASAFAANAPDTPIVTGPSFQQVPASSILVTPTGGSQQTLAAALSSGSYTLPIATTSILGGIKPDGTSITVNGSGVASSVSSYTLPIATTSILGGIKPDGTTITVNGSGVASAVAIGFAIGTTTITGGTAPCFLENSTSTTSACTAVTGTGSVMLAASPTTTGTLTAAALTASGIVNTTAAAGYELSGANAISEIGTTNSSTSVGRLAGASLSSGSYGFSTFVGDSAGTNVSVAGEITCIGSGACQSEVSGSHLTAVGVYSLFYETGSTDTFLGNDSCRNCNGVTGSSGVGSYVHSNVFSSNNFVLGNNALYGNSGAMTFAGTPTASETITLTFTNACLPSSTHNLVYGVGAGPTLANIVTGLNTAWTADTTLINCNIRPFVASTPLPNVLSMTHQGTSAAGDIVSFAFATTGTTTATVTGGTQATGDGSMIAIGLDAIQGSQMTTAARLIGIGENTFQTVTTATDDVAVGYLSAITCTTCSQNVMIGSQAGYAMTSGTGNVLLGYFAGQDITTNTLVAIGQYAGNMTTGNSSVCIGQAACRNETTGTANIVIGDNALLGISTGATGGQNVIIGNTAAGSSSQTGVQNAVMIGNLTGNACITCNYDIFIGYRTMDTTATSTFDQIVIAPGNTDVSTTVGTTSNVFYVFGNSTTPTLYATGTSGTTPSVFLPGGLLTVGAASVTNTHVAFVGNTPTITAGTATLDTNATDTAGTVTEGTTQTGFTLTFSGTFTTTPHCVVTSRTAVATTYTPSATTLIVSNASATGDVFDYACFK